MDQQPNIPTLKDSQKPQVKLKGLGGLTLLERLKQFKKKDLAFIMAGLGTLFMAPLAEHFMMSPDSGEGQLEKGWSGRGGQGNLFGGGSSPYESGTGLSAGGAVGGGGDVITPLNVRDPSALVMGPGATQQPPAGSAAPATAPAARNEADFKDALAGAAARGAAAGAKKAPLPVPKVALAGSGLRGLAAGSGGGTSASGGLGSIGGGAAGRPSGPGGGGLNLVRANPGFRGAAGARGLGNPSGLDATKRAAQNAGDAFTRSGGALNALNAAAGERIPSGGAGLGGGGQGGAAPNDAKFGSGGPGGNKSVGESLAFLAAKQRQEERLKLEFEKRRARDPELLWLTIRNEGLKTMGSKLAEAMAGTLTEAYGSLKGDSATVYLICGEVVRRKADAEKLICSDKWSTDCFEQDPVSKGFTHYPKGKTGPANPCRETKDTKGNPAPSAEAGVSGGGGFGEQGIATFASLADACSQFQKSLVDTEAPVTSRQGDELKAALAVGAQINDAKSALDNTVPLKPSSCAGSQSSPTSVRSQLLAVKNAVSGGEIYTNLQNPLKAADEAVDDKSYESLRVARKAIAQAHANLVGAEELLKKTNVKIKEIDAKAADVFALKSFVGSGDLSKIESAKAAALKSRDELKTVSEALTKQIEELRDPMNGLITTGVDKGGSVQAIVQTRLNYAAVRKGLDSEQPIADVAAPSADETSVKPFEGHQELSKESVEAAELAVKKAQPKIDKAKTILTQAASPNDVKANKEKAKELLDEAKKIIGAASTQQINVTDRIEESVRTKIPAGDKAEAKK